MFIQWLTAAVAFIAVADAAPAYSVLDHWTKRSNANVSKIRYCGGMFVGVGPAGLIITSPNGVHWVTQTSNTGSDLKGIAYGPIPGPGNIFVAVGDNKLLFSPDARHWTNIPLTDSVNLSDVTYSVSGFGSFVAVGTMFGGYTKNVLNLTVSNPFVSNWWSVTYTSVTNSIDCFRPGFPRDPASFRSIVRTENQFIAVGDICTGIWTSANGLSWTYRAGAGTEYFFGVAYGNNQALAVGIEGPPFVSSPPFSTWTPTATNQFSIFSSVGFDLNFDDGRFTAVRYGGSGSDVLESTNGAAWQIHTNVLPQYARTIAYGAGTYVVATEPVSPAGGIFQSDNIAGLLAIRRLANAGPVELLISIESNRVFGIEATTNLSQWSEIWRATNNGNAPTFVDWSVTNGTRRFYRTATP